MAKGDREGQLGLGAGMTTDMAFFDEVDHSELLQTPPTQEAVVLLVPVGEVKPKEKKKPHQDYFVKSGF